MKNALSLIFCMQSFAAVAETPSVFLEDNSGQRTKIASLNIDANGIYKVEMEEASFTDYFLSMRPFKCLTGPEKNWCHVPYPYEIQRDISDDLIDLEYDFLFVWKNTNDYGINMWNGVYYKIEQTNGRFSGVLHEMDMDALSAPPPKGELRPLHAKDLHKSDPDSHWLSRLVIE